MSETEKEFSKSVEEFIDEKTKNLDKKVMMAFVGNVSTGKSSLINAFFKCTRENQKVSVGAISGVTTKVKQLNLGDDVIVLDCPGLGDVIKENSAETTKILTNLDVGVLVVTGSADASQKQYYDELKAYCNKVFVVLNKIDEYDKKPSALAKVTEQWREVLALSQDEKIYQTCTDGFDPDYDPDAELDIRGVDDLREDVVAFMEKEGKALILQRQLMKKSALAKKVILAALVAVAGAAFIPGSAVWISGTQAATIMSIHYIYTGEILSKQHAIAALPVFASQSIGTNLFLWAKSVLPPTGAVDAVAAAVAIGVTLAMLSAVNWIYENGYNLSNKTEMKEQFNNFYQLLQKIGLKEIATIFVNKDMNKINELLAKFIKP